MTQEQIGRYLKRPDWCLNSCPLEQRMRGRVIMHTILCILFILFLAVNTYAEWFIKAGPVYRAGMDMNVSGSSYVQTLGLHAQNSSSRGTGSGSPSLMPLNDASGYADRTFDDGFVFMDPSTAVNGDTWYWGYNNASQVDLSRDTLSFHRTGSDETASSYRTSVSRRTIRDESIFADQTISGWGIELSGGYVMRESQKFKWSVIGGVDGFDNETMHVWAEPYAEQIDTRKTETIATYSSSSTYTYDLMGVVPPSAPYNGTYNGWPPPSPIIPNSPASLEETQKEKSRTTRGVATSTETARNTVSMDIDSTIFEFWTGVRMDWEPNDTIAIFAQPTISLNAVSIDGERTENWLLEQGGSVRTLQTWKESVNTTDWLFGMGLQGGIEWDNNDRWFVSIHVGYDWVNDKATAELGPNPIAFDISGYTAGAEIGRYY